MQAKFSDLQHTNRSSFIETTHRNTPNLVFPKPRMGALSVLYTSTFLWDGIQRKRAAARRMQQHHPGRANETTWHDPNNRAPASARAGQTKQLAMGRTILTARPHARDGAAGVTQAAPGVTGPGRRRLSRDIMVYSIATAHKPLHG